jgi:hypothetical protein
VPKKDDVHGKPCPADFKSRHVISGLNAVLVQVYLRVDADELSCMQYQCHVADSVRPAFEHADDRRDREAPEGSCQVPDFWVIEGPPTGGDCAGIVENWPSLARSHPHDATIGTSFKLSRRASLVPGSGAGDEYGAGCTPARPGRGRCRTVPHERHLGGTVMRRLGDERL